MTRSTRIAFLLAATLAPLSVVAATEIESGVSATERSAGVFVKYRPTKESRWTKTGDVRAIADVPERVAWLGVDIEPVDGATADGLGRSESGGALVRAVTPGGPAEASGIESGDVILMFKGQAVRDQEHLARLVREQQPSDTVLLHVARGAQRFFITVHLGSAPRPGPPEHPRGQTVRIRFKIPHQYVSCVRPSASMTRSDLELTIVATCIPQDKVVLIPIFYFYSSDGVLVYSTSSFGQYRVTFPLQASFETFDTPGVRACEEGRCSPAKPSVTRGFRQIVPDGVASNVAFVEILLSK